MQGGLVRLRPILMTAFNTSFALIPRAVFASDEGEIIGAELATVVIGGLASSTFLTLIIVPVVYTLVHSSLPRLFRVVGSNLSRLQKENAQRVTSNRPADGGQRACLIS